MAVALYGTRSGIRTGEGPVFEAVERILTERGLAMSAANAN